MEKPYKSGKVRKEEGHDTWKTSMFTALIFTIRSMSAYET